MLLFTKRLIDDVIRKKAPPNTMYFVEAINIANATAQAGTLLVLDRYLPYTTTDTIDQDANNVIVAFDLQTAGLTHLIDHIDHMTKYLSIGKTNTAVTNCQVSVYGRIVSASKIQLIIEWFRKGGV